MQREQCISSQNGKRYLLQPIYNLSILDLEIMLASCVRPQSEEDYFNAQKIFVSGSLPVCSGLL